MARCFFFHLNPSLFQYLLNLPWDFGWVGSEPGLCGHGNGICYSKPHPDSCVGEMHISDAGNIMVNTGSGCKSIHTLVRLRYVVPLGKSFDPENSCHSGI